jgi:hypothetical protein
LALLISESVLALENKVLLTKKATFKGKDLGIWLLGEVDTGERSKSIVMGDGAVGFMEICKVLDT